MTARPAMDTSRRRALGGPSLYLGATAVRWLSRLSEGAETDPDSLIR